MSMDLYLWKSPVTDDEEEAGRLVGRYFEQKEQGVFAPSPEIAAAAEELMRLYPIRRVSGADVIGAMTDEERGRYTEQGLADLLEHGSYTQDEDGPWSDLPFDQTDSLLVLNIRWSAGDQVLDDILRLGRKHELVIYDPQGPSIYLPTDPVGSEPDQPPKMTDALKMLPLAALLVGLTYAAWLIPIGWIRWPAVIIAGFIACAGLFVFALMIAGALGWDPDKQH